MDALKLLKEEAARKRKALSENGVKGKKYIKRSELERIERGVDDEKDTNNKADTRQSEIKSSGGEEPGKSHLLSPTSIVAPPEMKAAIFSIPRSEVVRRLRERGEPIRLFGESDRDVCIRLRQIEILAPEINKGLRNDFKDAMDKLDQEYLDQLAKHEGDGGESSDLKFKDDGTTLEELLASIDDLTGEDENKRQDLCLKTFKLLLKEWILDLNDRPMLEKRSYKGKMESAKFKQTESYLSPLFKQLKKKTTPPDILNFLCRICVCILNREYIQANDAYLSMAIGNAPWPIGVTMVGIHARTGREKIFSQQIAHVLNDETQRKYIQAVKRLMTFAQVRFPTDPSKCVEYGGIKT